MVAPSAKGGTARERRGGGGALGRRAKRSKGAPAESARRRCTEEGRTAHVRVGVTNGLGEVFSDANCQVPRALPSVPLSYTQRCLFLSERLRESRRKLATLCLPSLGRVKVMSHRRLNDPPAYIHTFCLFPTRQTTLAISVQVCKVFNAARPTTYRVEQKKYR